MRFLLLPHHQPLFKVTSNRIYLFRLQSFWLVRETLNFYFWFLLSLSFYMCLITSGKSWPEMESSHRYLRHIHIQARASFLSVMHKAIQTNFKFSAMKIYRKKFTSVSFIQQNKIAIWFSKDQIRIIWGTWSCVLHSIVQHTQHFVVYSHVIEVAMHLTQIPLVRKNSPSFLSIIIIFIYCKVIFVLICSLLFFLSFPLNMPMYEIGTWIALCAR